MTAESTRTSSPPPAGLPRRLHHNAFVVQDQEATRRFYEDILGLPLKAMWIETAMHKGERLEYSHAFYGMADGSALAFFNFADPAVQKKYYAARADNLFQHIAFECDEATQNSLRARCAAAGIPVRDIEHGYCKSLYVTDPDGLIVEFTVDPPNVGEINDYQEETAHDSLRRWQAGDRRPNNLMRRG
jgi:catechol 2,3-dioxygenase-like lactoylglutathione lyase family enzyme